MNTALTVSTLANDPGWHHGPGDGPGWWIVFPIAWFLLIAGGIATAVLMRRRWHQQAGLRAGESVLAERFARGELDDNEYAARLETLRRTGH